MVDPLSTTRTKFATLKGRGAHVEDEAIMVVSVPAVHPLHVGGGLLVVHRVGWVGWKQTLSAYLSKKLCSVKCFLTYPTVYLARLDWVSLNACYKESNSSLEAWSGRKWRRVRLWFFGSFNASPSQLFGVFNKPGAEHSWEVAV